MCISCHPGCCKRFFIMVFSLNQIQQEFIIKRCKNIPLIHLPAFFFPIKIFMFICQTRIAIEKCLSLNILEPFSEIREFCFPFKHSFLCCSDKGQNKRIKIQGPQWLNVTHGCFWSCSVTITYGRTNARHLHCGPAKPPALPVGSPTWTSILWSAFSMW